MSFPVGSGILVKRGLLIAPLPDEVVLEAIAWNSWTGDRTLDATEFGGSTTVYDEEIRRGGGNDGAWHNYLLSYGTREIERRGWKTWLIPPTTTRVDIVGSAQATIYVGDGVLTGLPVTADVNVQMGTVIFDVDSPPSWGNTGSGMSGVVQWTANAAPTEDETPIINFSFSTSTFGPAYPGFEDGSWRSLQISLVNNSPVGIGRRQTHSTFGHPAPGPEGDFRGVYPRFPDNPSWHFGIADYADYTYVQSAFTTDLDVVAYGPA